MTKLFDIHTLFQIAYEYEPNAVIFGKTSKLKPPTNKFNKWFGEIYCELSELFFFKLMEYVYGFLFINILS